MPGKLKAIDIPRLINSGKYADGDGLYLVVASPTSRSWSYRYWTSGKQRWHGLGSLKDVSLSEARLKRDAARLQVKGDRGAPGIDIVERKRTAREEKKAIEIIIPARKFRQCAEDYIEQNWSGWSEKHRAQWPATLKRYA
jgi:hypothetical protein